MALATLRREFGIRRLELDDDDARSFDRKDREPLVVGLQRALFGDPLHRVARQADQRQHRLRIDTPPSAGSNSGRSVELQLADDIERDLARQRDLHLVGDRFLIADQRFARDLLGIRPQEYVLAALDQHARFGLVARRHDIARRRTSAPQTTSVGIDNP